MYAVISMSFLMDERVMICRIYQVLPGKRDIAPFRAQVGRGIQSSGQKKGRH